MTTRTIVTRRRRVDQKESQDFNFTEEMLPIFSGNGNIPDVIKEYHSQAWSTYKSLPLPTSTDEAWRRTNLSTMPIGSFKMPEIGNISTQISTPPKELLKPLVGESHGGQIVMMPNETTVELDRDLAARGVVFVDLATAERKYSDQLTRFLGKIVRSDESKFSALAAAMSRLGVFVYIPEGVQVELPLHSILWGPGTNLAYFSHILVCLEKGASLTYVHEAASHNEVNGSTLHTGMVEIYVGQEANLRFVELQSWGEHVWNFSHERAQIERDANLDWIFGAIGSHLTKNFSDINLIGQGATGRMSGFYFTDGVQHLDHDTQQNHLAPHTTSDLLFKGALKGNSRSVWQGMIYVATGAQKTDGYQANRNLVLSRGARADSIPGLEILADDVRCTHGATVGKIDRDQIFYLRSRGIPYAEAERLIVEGFFDPIMQRIPYEGVRTRFQEAIIQKMD